MIELLQEEKFFVTEALKIYSELYANRTFLLDIDLNNKNKEKR